MNLKTLSNGNLVSCFGNLVRSERKITAQILECISEIDRRKLYMKNHTNLFDFLVKDFGYSPGAAMRRIDGARLLSELPETAIKFEDGSLTLSQANQIQRASREFKKMKSEILSTANKRELVLQIENTTQKQTEQILAKTLDLPVIPVQKETLHRDDSVTLTVTFTAEQMQILEQAQNMISHAVVKKDWSVILTHLAKREVARRTTVRRAPAKKTHKIDDLANFDPANVVAAVESKKINTSNRKTAPTLRKKNTNRLAIPAAIRKTLLHAGACCGYRDQNGKQCANQRFLQIDHIHNWSWGGTHDLQNLQVLCGTHNRLKYGQAQSRGW